MNYVVRASGTVYQDSVSFVMTTIREIEPGSAIVMTQEGPTEVLISDPIILGQGEIKWVDDHAGTETVDKRVITTRAIRITEGHGRATVITSRQTWVGEDELTFVGLALRNVVTKEPASSVGIELLFDLKRLPQHVYIGFAPEGWVGEVEDDVDNLVCFDDGGHIVRGTTELVVLEDGTVGAIVQDIPWVIEEAQAARFQVDTFVIAWTYPESE